MKTTVAVYDSHDKAFEAIKALDKARFPMKQVSLVGKAELIDDHLHVRSRDNISIAAPVAIGAIAGPIVGVLTGIGIFAIPGLGFLYGAGAVIGAFAGLDFGMITGIIAGVLTTLGIRKDKVVKYEEHLKVGKFLIVVQGNEKEIEEAEKILHKQGAYLEMEKH